MVRNRDIDSQMTNEQNADSTQGASPAPAAAKKSFVEPAISVPADVLEATAFFQVPTASTGDTDGVD